MIFKYYFLLVSFFIAFNTFAIDKRELIVYSKVENDLVRTLKLNKVKFKLVNSWGALERNINSVSAIIVTADDYPNAPQNVPKSIIHKINSLAIPAYFEFVTFDKDVPIIKTTTLERGIVTTSSFGTGLPPLSLLGVNDCHFIVENGNVIKDPLLVVGKVVGLYRAEYGIDDVETFPLLYKTGRWIISTTKLSNFVTGRYGPQSGWKVLWSYILGDIIQPDKPLVIDTLPQDVEPMYSKHFRLPKRARPDAIVLGVEWFSNAKLYLERSWYDNYLKYEGDGGNPYGPPPEDKWPNGDGSLGLLEGHASKIYYDGTQQYRYWMRADVQGEASLALALASDFSKNNDYATRSKNLIKFVFEHSNLRGGERSDPQSSSYGLLGWSTTHPFIYYGDDNARAILGLIGASSKMNFHDYDQQIVEAILGNFRTTGKNGFRGERIEDKDLQSKGWEHFRDREITNYAPHFEAWTWATYLWLYDKTGYEPLLTKTKKGIEKIMQVYPDQWRWTNGLQQERARMLLVLSWLVRIEDNAVHRSWLDQMVSSIIDNQDASGAIMEWLGDDSQGRYGKTKTNASYGKREAPLIFNNGDPVADLLYTSNFAFFGLNEAYHATQDKRYKLALDNLSDFLIRVQVKSQNHKDLHGAWFRGFEFANWEYWASNADAGWGAWGTLSGWTQSWIVATQALMEKETSLWDLTKNYTIRETFAEAKHKMIK